MTDPEIFHRCPGCGASIKERAFFCPECGKQIENAPEQSNDNSSEAATDLAVEEEVQPAAVSATADEIGALQTKPVSNARQRPGGHAPQYGSKKEKQRTNALRAEGSVGQRVDRIRRISTHVLDEAGYDPSLRFLLVAAALFVLFLTILVMSKLIG